MLTPRPGEEPPGLPRSQSGANPQHLMATLLGDFWLDREEHLPSASLVDLVREFDVTTASARAALSRLLRRGTLDAHRSGRRTYYRLSATARTELRATRDALVASTTPPVAQWDGSWLVVAFSVSEDRREVRHALRAGLRRAGFGPLYDGVWASPTASPDVLVGLLAELGVDQSTVLRSSVVHPDGGAGHPAAAWDLDGVAAALRGFTQAYGPLLAELDAGRVDPRTALRRRAEVLQAWRGIVDGEPVLPAQLLPPDWPRPAATAVFVQALDALAPLAEQRFREVVGQESAELAALAQVRRLSTDAPL